MKRFSWIDGRLYRSDLQRLSWAFWIFLALCLYAWPFGKAALASDAARLMQDPTLEETYTSLLFSITNPINEVLLLYFIGAGALSVWLLSEEKSRATLEIAVAGPYYRSEIFFSKMLTGATLLLVPMLLAATGLFLIGRFYPIVGGYWTLGTILKHTLQIFLIAYSLFSFYMLCGCLFGQTFVHLFIATVFLVLPLGVFQMLLENSRLLSQTAMFTWLRSLAEPLSWEMIRQAAYRSTPLIIFMDAADLPGLSGLAGQVLGVLGLQGLAAWLFDKMPMERNGYALTFPSSAGVMRAGILVCSALLAGAISTTISWSVGMWLAAVVLGAGIGYWVPKKIFERRLS